MSRLQPAKLHVRYTTGATPEGPRHPRRYTLTHSDATGDLFLTVGYDYDSRQIAGWYTRLMRDEVLAAWEADEAGPCLHIYCHISGGFVVGSARWRYAIFQHELPLVLEALRFGDQRFYETNPDLETAPILVNFEARNRRYQRTERWGSPGDYRLHTDR